MVAYRRVAPRVRVTTDEPVTRRIEPPASFESMTKDELIETARAQNLPTSGTKADIIARLRTPS